VSKDSYTDILSDFLDFYREFIDGFDLEDIITDLANDVVDEPSPNDIVKSALIVEGLSNLAQKYGYNYSDEYRDRLYVLGLDIMNG